MTLRGTWECSNRELQWPLLLLLTIPDFLLKPVFVSLRNSYAETQPHLEVGLWEVSSHEGGIRALAKRTQRSSSASAM